MPHNYPDGDMFPNDPRSPCYDEPDEDEDTDTDSDESEDSA